MKMRSLLCAVLFPVFLSCASGPVVVPEDMTPSKIIQRAQEAMDNNKYKVAIQYYQVLMERHGDVNEYYCIAEYEIAFIRYKQKQFAEARRGFEGLLVLYSAEGGDTLPRQFKVLSEKVLAHMDERGY